MQRPIPPSKPWDLPEISEPELLAIKQVSEGLAGPMQQKIALATIVKKIAGIYDMSFRPGGLEGARETDFAEGRRFVGTRIMEAVERPMRESAKLEVDDARAKDRRNPKPPAPRDRPIKPGDSASA